MPIKYPQAKKRSHKRRNTTLILVAAVIVVAAGGFWWHHHKDQEKAAAVVTHIKTNQGATVTANPNVPATSNGNPTSTGTSASKDNQANQPGTAPMQTVQPATPTGEFISDNTPNLSGSPHPSSESSVCTTTPGVQCTIKFTDGSKVISLPSQTTNGDGGASWNWTLQQYGFTQGTWAITAVASNGSKTATASYSMKLDVSQ